MRINLFVAFIISTFLCIKISDVVSVLTPQKIFWIYIIPSIFLILAIFYKKIKFIKHIMSQVFLILFTSVPYIVYVVFALLCLINFPPEDKFEAKLKPEQVTEQETSAGKELNRLLDEFEKKLDTSDKDLYSKLDINDSNKVKVTDLLNKTNTNRKEVIDFISKNNIAKYNDYSTEKQIYIFETDSSSPENNINSLISVFKIELLEIEMLKKEQKYNEAVNKYIRSWQKLAKAYEIKNNSVIDSLCLIAISKSLGEYYYNNQELFLAYDLQEVTSLKKGIIDNLDRTFRIGFTSEYYHLRASIEKTKNIWPLMDRNKYFRKLDGYYYSMVEAERNPLDIIPYEEPLDFNYLVNPFVSEDYIGSILYTINVSMFSGIVANTISKKNEFNIYFYAMEKNNYKNIPLDYFTGKELKVVDFPDHIEIDVYKNSRLDATQKYVIIKEATD